MTSHTVLRIPLHAVVMSAALTAACASTAPAQRCPEVAPRPKPVVRQPTDDTPPLPSIPLPPELDRVLRDYEAGWTGRSPEALARLFTDDGFVLEPGRPPLRGHDGIIHAYTGAGGPLALRALAYATDGDVGYIIGGFAPATDKPDIGKFILLVRRAPGGEWKIAADMDNGSPHR
jgi:ketosteroid isomerase-like protein